MHRSRMFCSSSGRITTAIRKAALALTLIAILTVRARGQTDSLPRPISLTALLRSVQQDNPRIAAGSAQVRAAQGALVSARTWSNPVVNYESDRMSGQTSGSGSASQETMTTAMLPLEPLYQRGPQINRGAALVRAARADALSVRQRVALDAAGAYYAAALAEVRVSTARELAGWLDSVVEYNGNRVREGVAAEVDLVRSSLERDAVENELAMAESDLARARAALGSFLPDTRDDTLPLPEIDSLPLAIPARPVSVLRADAAGLARSRIEPLSFPATFLRQPEIRAAQERLAAATTGIASERRMLLREASVMLGVKKSAGMSSLMSGFSLPLPLFDQNRGSVLTARAERDVAENELSVAERNATADLRGAQHSAGLLTSRVAALNKTAYLVRANEARRITLGAYKEGGATLLQVIDAARAWRDARNSYFETLYAQHQAVIDLLVAQGIDLLASPPILSPEGGQ